MIPGQILGVEGQRCTFTRTKEKGSIRQAFQGFLEAFFKQFEETKKNDPMKAKEMRKQEPKYSRFASIVGRKLISSFERVEEHGVIVQENKRTVWVRFGGNIVMKVKKARVQLAE